MEGRDHPVKSSVDSTASASEGKKPNVRVIPIEVEGAETTPSGRHRTLSGPAGYAKNERGMTQKEDSSPLKRSMQDLSEPSKIRATEGPVVHNIPIKIESKTESLKCAKSDKAKLSNSKNDHIKLNGCAVSKQNKAKTPEKEQKSESPTEISLKKISNVLEELKSYENEVEKFIGTVKDKQYRYLDEMLTRCMLRLDDIDTMGNEDVRSARKNAVKKVQACIDLLETKVTSNGESELESTADVQKEEVMNTDMNEANDGDAEMTDVTSENVESRDSQDIVAEMQVTEDNAVENKIPNTSSSVVTDVSLDLVAEKTEDLPSINNLQEIETVQSKFDDCSSGNVPTNEIDMDQDAAVKTEFLAERDVKKLDSEQWVSSTTMTDNASINTTAEVEMCEAESSEFQKSTSNEDEIRNSNDISESKKETSRCVTEIDNICNENKTDIEMKDVQCNDEISEDLSTLSTNPVAQMASNEHLDISGESEKVNCDKKPVEDSLENASTEKSQ